MIIKKNTSKKKKKQSANSAKHLFSMFTIYNVPDNTSSHINQAPYLTGDNSNNSERGVPKGGVHAQKSCLRKFLPSCVPRTRCICQKSARGTCWDGTFSRVPRTGPTLHPPFFRTINWVGEAHLAPVSPRFRKNVTIYLEYGSEILIWV